MSSHFLLSFAAFLFFFVFLYSNRSHSNTPITSDTNGSLIRDTRPLASKALLRRDNVNALLSPHIYNVLIRKEYQLTELTRPLAQEDAKGGETCLEQATQFCSNNDQLHIARVSFTDSVVKWTLCHCVIPKPQDPEPWPYLLSHLSRLPIHLRHQIQTVMLVPLSLSPLVSSTRQQSMTPPHGMFSASPPLVTFFGYPSIGTWIHEFAHSADFHYASTMFSASEQWARAVQRDNCVVDEYARTSQEEALAQAAMVKSYLVGRPSISSVYTSQNVEDIFTKAPYPPSRSRDYIDALLGDYSCMRHQLMALSCLDAFYTLAGQSDACAVLENAGHDMTTERSALAPQFGTWWELWLVTNLLIVLFMLAQL
jgi:hypothetical protein